MDQPPPIGPTVRPRLASYVRQQFDDARDNWVLQAPERVIFLDDTSKVILDLCDGSRDVDEIVSQLAEEYDAPRYVIAHDVLALLRLLAEKNLLDRGDDTDGVE